MAFGWLICYQNSAALHAPNANPSFRCEPQEPFREQRNYFPRLLHEIGRDVFRRQDGWRYKVEELAGGLERGLFSG